MPYFVKGTVGLLLTLNDLLAADSSPQQRAQNESRMAGGPGGAEVVSAPRQPQTYRVVQPDGQVDIVSPP